MTTCLWLLAIKKGTSSASSSETERTAAKISYPLGTDGETPGTFLCCQRCGKENHDAGTIAPGAGAGGLGNIG